MPVRLSRFNNQEATREIVGPLPEWLDRDDHDDDHDWTPRELLAVVGWPRRADRTADYLTTIQAWHDRFHGGPIPALFAPDAQVEEDQPVRRVVFDTWRRVHEQVFLEARDNAFGMQLGALSSGGTHLDHDMPWFGHYPDIDHVNAYLSGLLPPQGAPLDPDVDITTRWMAGDQVGPDRAHVYLLANGVSLRGYRQPADEVEHTYMVSTVDQYTHNRSLNVVGDAPVAGDPPTHLHHLRLVPSTGPLPERAERDLVATVIHELHHAFGLGDEYEGDRTDAWQADTAVNLVPTILDNGVPGTDGGRLIQAGVRWDLPRALWAERVLEVDLPGDGTIHVRLPDRGEEFRPADELLDNLRLRRGVRRYENTDDLDPPPVSDQLEVDRAASTFPDLVLVPAGGGALPDPATLEDRPVLFAPVLLDPGDPDSLATLLSTVIRDHLIADQTIMNPDHACDPATGPNPTVTQPQDLPIAWVPSPPQVVGLYLGGSLTRCGALRPTGISRMRYSHPERPAAELYPVLGQIANALAGVTTAVNVSLPWDLSTLPAVLPLSVVEAYTIADVIDPFQLALIDRAHRPHVPRAAP